MKLHEQRDLKNKVTDDTLALIMRSADVFAPSPLALGLAGDAAMTAGFIAMFCAAKMESNDPFTAEQLLTRWVELTLSKVQSFDKDFLAALAKVSKNV